MFLNVMTPLIMVISFSNSMQLTFAAREHILRGQSKREAFRQAILVVGPACVLTHAPRPCRLSRCNSPSPISFAALARPACWPRDRARRGAHAGAAAWPAAGARGGRPRRAGRDRRPAVNWLRVFCAWIAVKMVNRPVLYSAIAVIVVAGLGVVYAQLPARYRLADQLPDREEPVQAGKLIDSELHGEIRSTC